MSIETEFQSTIENVQNAYQGLANLGADLTNVDKNIENIAELLDGVYDVLPKTSFQEGTEITLSNTLKGKLDFENDIVGYGDISQKSYSGYNILENKMANSVTNNGVTYTKRADGSVLVNGTATATSFCVLTNNTNNINYYQDKKFTMQNYYYYTPRGGTNDVNIGFRATDGSYVSPSQIGGKDIGIVYLNVSSGVTINNQIVYPMIVNGSSEQKPYEPYVGGIASPNPSYPQDIEVVRGRNLFNDELEVGGFDGEGLNSGGNVRLRSKGYTQIESNTNYTINAKNNTSKTLNVSISYYTANDFVTHRTGYLSFTTLPYTFSIPSGCKYIRVLFKYTDESSMNIENVSNVMLEQGSQATSYLPYNTIEEVVSGKNVLNFVKWLENARAYGQRNGNTGMGGGTLDSYTDNSFTFTASGNDCYSQSFTMNGTASVNKTFCELYPHLVFEVEPSTYYTLSFKRSNETLPARPMFFYLDENYNYLSLADSGSLNISSFARQTPSNCKYMLFRIGLVNNSGASMTISNLQLEKGNTSSDYEPYHTPITYPISLGDIELCKIGNYADELLYDVVNDKVYKNKKIGKVVLNGTETWTKGETEQYRRFSTSNISTLKQTTGRIECLSNYFKYDYSATGHNVGTIFTYWTENGSIFVYPETTITTAEQLKTWLSTHNTIVYFILETPTSTEITGTLKDQIKALYNSQSFTGTTIIESNGDLPMIIKVRALKGE